MKLRDYQENAVSLAATQSKPTLVVAPTGAGKGVMAVELMLRLASQGYLVLYVVHRRELVDDTVRRLSRRHITAGTLGQNGAKIRVTTVQSIVRGKLSTTMRAHVLVLDEAHHYAASEWAKIKAAVMPRKIVGFTATPQRPDGRSLGDMFSHIIDVIPYSELLKRELIVPARVVRPRQRMGSRELALDPVQAYLEHGRSEPALFFFATVAESIACASALNANGVKAAAVHARGMRWERMSRIMRDLEEGKLQAVTNVGILGEGFDAPHVSCVVLARQCKHASTYIQIAGRALRAAEGKTEATLIDLVGASHRHGPPAIDRTYSLDGSGISEDSRSPNRRHDYDATLRDVEFLGLDLEVLSAEHAQQFVLPSLLTKQERYHLKNTRGPMAPAPGTYLVPEHERKSKYAPKTRRGPMARSPGFIYEDRGFWQLAWREFGAKQRMGLCTTDKAVAEELYALFGAEGPAAVQAQVMLRRRDACSAYFDKEKGMFALSRWDGKRIRREKKALFTTDEAVAKEMVEFAKAGAQSDLENAIARAKRTWTGNDKRTKGEQMRDWWAARRESAAP